MTAPTQLVFGLHVHQPVGNFDHVVEQHVRDVYRPFLEHVTAAGFFPLTLHLSGPLLEWLDAHETPLLDAIGRLVADGRLELLLSGFDEPILAALPRADRAEQIGRMRDYLRRRFGTQATGLWLTERVWQPELAADLAAAGVEYTFVDDRHFLVGGFQREALHRPYRTESDGRAINLLAIDERLRYLIPFRPPEETAGYLRQLRAAGQPLAVLADDGEKFGGWPGTREWVYEKEWLLKFLRAMRGLIDAGELALVRAVDAVRHVPSGGLAYLGTASYREMEKWALPGAAQREFEALEHAHPDSAFVRGGNWPHFLVKYPEANRMHKTMVALSNLARERGDPPAARRALGRAQCNDAYWHGVFGGLYLPHLRHAVWRQLAIAERELRRGEALTYEMLDVDQDGDAEVWIHGERFSALVSPRRGGAVETLVHFAAERNVVDTLTRRREPYHEAAVEQHGTASGPGNGTLSIHDMEGAARLTALPPADREPRALLVERLLAGSVTEQDYACGTYVPLVTWADAPMTVAVEQGIDAITLILTARGLEKTLRFGGDGCISVRYRWDATGLPAGAVFAPELSFHGDVQLKTDPPATSWSYAIATVARSERGFESTVQGLAVTPRWPAELGQARLDIEVSGS